MTTTPKPKRRRAPGAGRPPILDQGRRVQVILDAPSLRTAEALGAGNVSLGIRRALALVRGSDA